MGYCEDIPLVATVLRMKNGMQEQEYSVTV